MIEKEKILKITVNADRTFSIDGKIYNIPDGFRIIDDSFDDPEMKLDHENFIINTPIQYIDTGIIPKEN